MKAKHCQDWVSYTDLEHGPCVPLPNHTDVGRMWSYEDPVLVRCAYSHPTLSTAICHPRRRFISGWLRGQSGSSHHNFGGMYFKTITGAWRYCCTDTPKRARLTQRLSHLGDSNEDSINHRIMIKVLEFKVTLLFFLQKLNVTNIWELQITLGWQKDTLCFVAFDAIGFYMAWMLTHREESRGH